MIAERHRDARVVRVKVVNTHTREDFPLDKVVFVFHRHIKDDVADVLTIIFQINMTL